MLEQRLECGAVGLGSRLGRGGRILTDQPERQRGNGYVRFGRARRLERMFTNVIGSPVSRLEAP
jgi:hypothetical protein